MLHTHSALAPSCLNRLHVVPDLRRSRAGPKTPKEAPLFVLHRSDMPIIPLLHLRYETRALANPYEMNRWNTDDAVQSPRRVSTW